MPCLSSPGNHPLCHACLPSPWSLRVAIPASSSSPVYCCCSFQHIARRVTLTVKCLLRMHALHFVSMPCDHRTFAWQHQTLFSCAAFENSCSVLRSSTHAPSLTSSRGTHLLHMQALQSQWRCAWQHGIFFFNRAFLWEFMLRFA